MHCQSQQHLKKRESGYSIVEILVVALIVSVLAGIALINLTKIIEAQRLKSISIYLSNYLNETRKESIQNDYPCKIEINNTTRTISIGNIDGATGPAADGQCFNPSTNPIDLNSIEDTPKGLKICSATIPSSIDVSTQVVSDLLTFAANDDCMFEEPPNPKSTSTSSNLTFTPSGLTTTSLMIKLKSSSLQSQRCILVLAPIGMVKNGIQSSNETCDFTNFN